MLQPRTTLWGLPCGIPRFWRLRVDKDFPKPEYYIGQTVLHRLKLVDKEIYSHVSIMGIAWTGFGWEYLVEFPSNHPVSNLQDDQQWAESHELSTVFTSANLIKSVGAQVEKLNLDPTTCQKLVKFALSISKNYHKCSGAKRTS